MDVHYLTFQEVVQLHDLLCFFYGGATELLNRGNIDSAMAQPRQGFSGQEFFPTLHLKAAYCYYLALAHGFRDGSKRTGVAAAFHFLRKNGTYPSCDQNTLSTAVMRVMAHTCTVEELAAILEGVPFRPPGNPPSQGEERQETPPPE